MHKCDKFMIVNITVSCTIHELPEVGEVRCIVVGIAASKKARTSANVSTRANHKRTR